MTNDDSSIQFAHEDDAVRAAARDDGVFRRAKRDAGHHALVPRKLVLQLGVLDFPDVHARVRGPRPHARAVGVERASQECLFKIVRVPDESLRLAFALDERARVPHPQRVIHRVTQHERPARRNV